MGGHKGLFSSFGADDMNGQALLLNRFVEGSARPETQQRYGDFDGHQRAMPVKQPSERHFSEHIVPLCPNNAERKGPCML